MKEGEDFMEHWRYFNNQNDIEEFMKVTMGMHDAYMVGLGYVSGNWEDERMTHFGGSKSKNLRVIFGSPWIDGKIEMIFETVCRFNIAGWQEWYSDEMFECLIGIEKLKATSDETYIYWTDGGSPRACSKEDILTEPFNTYIVSKRARWRIIKQNYKCPCCGYYTFEHPPMGEFNNCPVCCWLDDTQCLNDLDYVSEGLGISLRQARKNFYVMRACKDEFVSEVRPPKETELDGINWIMPCDGY